MNSGQNEWLSKAEDLADRVSFSKQSWTFGGRKQIYDNSLNVIINYKCQDLPSTGKSLVV